MIVQGKSAFAYWNDTNYDENGIEKKYEQLYSWKEVFGKNPFSLILPYDHKYGSKKIDGNYQIQERI